MIPLVIVGSGGHGREIAGIVQVLCEGNSEYELLGVVAQAADDDDLLTARGIRHLGGNEVLSRHVGEYVVGVGDPEVRRSIDRTYSTSTCVPAVIVDPTAWIGADLEPGPGFVAFPGVVVTTNVYVGRHVHLNAGSTVSHDCVLGDYVTLSPGCHVSGNVTLEEGVTLGIGAVVRQGVTIGAATFVGAGAVVVSDLPPGITAVGVPARPIER